MSKLTGSEVSGLMEAYNRVYAPVEVTEEEFIEQVEEWVNSLVEEGYDLSEYTWDDMYLIAEDEFGRAGLAGGRTTGRTLRDVGGAYAQGFTGTRTTSANPVAQVANAYSRNLTAIPRTGIRFAQGLGQGLLGGGGSPKGSPKTGGTSTKPSPKPIPNVSNIPPKEGTGKGGPSDINRKTGGPGGTASGGTTTRPQTQPGRTSTSPTPRPTGAPPTVKVAPATPAAAPTGFQLASRGVDVSRVAAPTAPTAVSSGPSAAALERAKNLKAGGPRPTGRDEMIQANIKRATSINSSFDMFDLVIGHLLDEGYANTEEAALAIMANMSEDWKESILDEAMSSYDRNRQRAAQRAAARNEARKAGKTGNVPGVGYVSPRPERETYRDSAGTERHHTGGKMPKKD